MGTLKTEMRRFDRQAFRIPAWLYFHGWDAPLFAESENIALEGAQFESLRPVAVGAPVIVRLHLHASGAEIECKGKVCWVGRNAGDAWCFGVRFLDLEEDERETLKRMLDFGS